MWFAPHWTLRIFWLVVVGVNSSCAKETKNQQQENIKRWLLKTDIGTVRFLKRSSRPEVFCKKVSLEISQNSQANTCARVSFFNKVAGLKKKRLWHRCFPVNFVKFLRTPFFIEHLWWLLLEMST